MAQAPQLLTLGREHRTGKVVWRAKGRHAETLDEFFDELGEARSSQITAVSMDMGPAFAKSVRAEGNAPLATICFDPFHVVAIGTKTLEEVRRPFVATDAASPPNRQWPASSKEPVGRCSRTPRTSPTARPRPASRDRLVE